MASYLQRAISHYGLTADPREAGYILPDGSLLDFSEGGRGQRSQDHRNVSFIVQGPSAKREAQLLRELEAIDLQDPSQRARREAIRRELRRMQDWTRTDAMWRFMDVTGAIRFMPESNSYELRRRPTSAQISSMKDATMLLGMPPNIDMRRPGRDEFNRYYDEWNVAEAWRDMREYWRRDE